MTLTHNKTTDSELKELQRLFLTVQMRRWTSEEVDNAAKEQFSKDSPLMAALSGYMRRLRSKYNLELNQVIDIETGEIRTIGEWVR
jgi:hypothetical protein